MLPTSIGSLAAAICGAMLAASRPADPMPKRRRVSDVGRGIVSSSCFLLRPTFPRRRAAEVVFSLVEDVRGLPQRGAQVGAEREARARDAAAPAGQTRRRAASAGFAALDHGGDVLGPVREPLGAGEGGRVDGEKEMA